MRKYIFDFLSTSRTKKTSPPIRSGAIFPTWSSSSTFSESTDASCSRPQTLRQFIAHLMKLKLKKSSIARKLSAIRSFFKYLNRAGHSCGQSRTAHCTPRREKRLPAVLTADDAQRLMDAPAATAAATWPDVILRDRAVLETLYSTGIRASELIGMNHDDIDRNDRLIRIRGKGRKERIVPIGQKALDAIDAYLDSQSETH